MTSSERKVGPGWHISPEGWNVITETGALKNPNTILQNALNADLKEVGKPVLATESSKNTIEELVLQIQKIRNVSAPKANEESQAAPRMLKLTLTDGHTYGQAIELTPLSGLSVDKTAPGSKVLIKNARICSGYILLTAQSCTYLGGKVPALYEKWEVSKNLLKQSRSNSTDGPPAWVKFGSQIVSLVSDQPFKSLDNKPKETVNQNAEFESQRKDAIVEASMGAVKKVFGGGVKASVNMQVSESQKRPPYERNNRNKRNEPREKVTEKEQQKPVERISLFQFLEEKLPEAADVLEVEKPVVSQRNYNNYKEFDRKPRQTPNHFVPPRNPYQNAPKPQSARSEVNFRPKVTENETESITNGLGKISLNAQFASRSLRKHLNLGEETMKSEPLDWKVGDACLAKYWEDGKYYNAVVTDVTERTCVVRFRDYGNLEEVLKGDCRTAGKREFRGQQFRSRRPRT